MAKQRPALRPYSCSWDDFATKEDSAATAQSLNTGWSVSRALDDSIRVGGDDIELCVLLDTCPIIH